MYNYLDHVMLSTQLFQLVTNTQICGILFRHLVLKIKYVCEGIHELAYFGRVVGVFVLVSVLTVSTGVVN